MDIRQRHPERGERAEALEWAKVQAGLIRSGARGWELWQAARGQSEEGEAHDCIQM